MRCDGGVEIAHAFAVLGRERDRIPETKRVSFSDANITGASFGFVSGEHDGLVCAAQKCGEGFIHRRHANARIDQKQNDVRFLDRHLRLLAHARFERRVGDVLEASRVDQREVQIAEFAARLTAVARYAWCVINDRNLLAMQAIEQSGLADIWAPDNRELDRHGAINQLNTTRRASSVTT